MRRRRITAIFVITLFIFVIGCSSAPASATERQVAKIQRGNININITASGNLTTAQEANLTFGSAGTVKEVLVKIGDRVKQGQVLAQLKTDDLESSLAQAQIKVKQAQQTLQNSESPTYSSGGGTQAGYVAPDPLTIEINQLSLNNAVANAALAETTLENATIKAPFDGLVTEVNNVAEDQVTGTAVIVRVIDSTRFQAVVLVNETDIYKLSIGTPATVRAVALPTYSFPAKISLMAETPTIQSNVVNYQVTVELDPLITSTGASGQTTTASSPTGTDAQQTTDGQSRSGQSTSAPGQGQQGRQQQRQSATTTPAPTAQNVRLREGLTVTVNIAVSQRNNILLVPTRAITSRGGASYVQFVTSPTAAEERAITVGISDGQNTEVVSGLNEGDQVVIPNGTVAPATTTPRQQQGGGFVPGVRLP